MFGVRQSDRRSPIASLRWGPTTLAVVAHPRTMIWAIPFQSKGTHSVKPQYLTQKQSACTECWFCVCHCFRSLFFIICIISHLGSSSLFVEMGEVLSNTVFSGYSVFKDYSLFCIQGHFCGIWGTRNWTLCLTAST